MNRPPLRILPLFSIILALLLLASCGPAVLPPVGSPRPSATSELFASPALTLTEGTPCPPANWPCPSDSMTLTAVMEPTLTAMSASTQVNLTAEIGATLNAVPTSTPPAWATVVPVPGDLGWGAVYGVIRDGVTNLPIEGVTVTCEHASYTSPYPCRGVTTTNSDGIYSFVPVFFHDTDRITLILEAPGYMPLRFEQPFFTQPELHADLGLFPITDASPTPTPFLMCTPPVCTDGVLVCGSPDGCIGGCGTICSPATATP